MQQDCTPEFTVATLVTDERQYAEMRASFEAGGFTEPFCEFRSVDNTGSVQTSAYAGLNRMLDEAQGRYVILCHQDVRLMDDGRKRLASLLEALDAADHTWALAGNAGGRAPGKLAVRISDPHGEDQKVGRLPARVATLDENFIVVKRTARLGFSRDLEGFHLYGADICLTADVLGYSAYVIDFHLRHLSPGRRSADFLQCAEAFRKKWSRALRPRWIQTTCMLMPVSGGLLYRWFGWIWSGRQKRLLLKLSPPPAVRGLLLCIGTLVAPADGSTQVPSQITYGISFENRAHHEAEITVGFSDLPDRPLELTMARSSPGRYALHEFAKNVYDLSASDATGNELVVTRPSPYGWTVEGHAGEVTVRYTLYGDHADGTYTAIDRSHAHLNMPATFVWARDLDDRPIELTVSVPDGTGWRVATQLAPTGDPFRFTAPDLYYFLDSPTEVSDFWLREWDVDGHTVRIALHHTGTEADAERYASAVAEIVSASVDVYGELPDFDFGTYTFLACYLPWAAGDGMEHRNSTVLTSTASLATNMTGLLGTVAHEFFHAWNVERIRPASLEPFDFERANMSRELWFAEGFTSYYDGLLMWRAGQISAEVFAQRAGGIANAVANAPGRTRFSAIEMSMQAPFVDAATSVDPVNRTNTFLSYYTWGAGIGLALDAALRTRFPGATLDDLMLDMWVTHGVSEEPYDVEALEAALARVTGDRGFAADFFDRFVRGREAPDFPGLLAPLGVDVAPASRERAWLGSVSMRYEAPGAVVLATPPEGSPLYLAGVDRGDRIISIDDAALDERDSFDGIVARLNPGDSVEVRFESRGETFSRTVRVEADPTLRGLWLPDGETTESQRALRSAWRSGRDL